MLLRINYIVNLIQVIDLVFYQNQGLFSCKIILLIIYNYDNQHFINSI